MEVEYGGDKSQERKHSDKDSYGEILACVERMDQGQ